MPGLLWFSDQEIKDLSAVLKRIEAKIDALILSDSQMEKIAMAAIDDLKTEVAKNSNVVGSATLALQGFMQQVADLTKELQDAVAANNTADIQAATAALAQNNASLLAAIPLVAQAVAANTK